MKKEAASALGLLALFGAVSVLGQETPAAAPPLPAIAGVIGDGSRFEIVKDGFRSSEGPVAMPDGSLLFAEHQASRIVRIDPAGNVSTLLEKSNVSSGLAYDSKGRLVSVQRGSAAEGKPQLGVLLPAAATLAVEGELGPFEFPNDLVVDRRGGIYFTDSGRNPPQGQNTARKGAATYYYRPDGRVIKISDEAFPNGIQLSPDEKVLYINNLHDEYVVAYDVQPDGSVRNRRNFGRLLAASPPQGAAVASGGSAAGFRRIGADGMAVDNAGRLYVTTTLGVQVLSPSGQHLGALPTSRAAQNVAFAGSDRKTLYVIGGGTVWKVATQAQGLMNRGK